MKRDRRVRGLALSCMALLTAWSVWAWAQPARPGATARPGRPLPAAQGPRPPGAHGLRPRGAGETLGPLTPPDARAVAAGETRSEEALANAERAGNQAPAPMNWTQFGGETPPFVAMLVNFGILIAGYYLLGKRPIAAGLQNRRDLIAKEIDEAHRMKEEAEARAKTYQAKLERLEQDASAAREALLRAGEAERERIVHEAEAKAERMRRDAEFLLEQELKQIRLDLWRDAVDAAVTAAADLLKRRVTPEDQERLAEQYLDDLAGSRTDRHAPEAAS